jgi:hypothetical protein
MPAGCWYSRKGTFAHKDVMLKLNVIIILKTKG